MKAADLYLKLEEDFKLSGCIDEWDVGDSGYIAESVFGHDAVLYVYGSEVIAGNKVAMIAGDGNIEEVYGMLSAMGINTYITGITSARSGYKPSVRAHEKAKQSGINMLGGTHYSTEKFACMKMNGYFNKLGLPCEFIPDRPCMDDM